MKILFVITKAVVGGAQTSVLNLAREMKARGHEAIVGFGDGDWLPAELAKDNIPFVRFKWLKRTHNPLANIFFIGEIWKYVRGKDFSAVHFNSSNALPGAVGAKLTGKVRTVFTFRGMSMLDEHYQTKSWLKFLYRCFFKFFLFFIDVPVFVSQENFDKFGRGQLTSKGLMIYNGLDAGRLNFISREEAVNFISRAANKDLSDKYLLGSIGRLDYAKNYEFLISVFPEILKIRPDAVAVIMGEGDERSKYEELIKSRGLSDKIILLGNIPNGSRYMAGFDLLVLPSRYEGLAIILIEALMADMPFLATDVGGNKELAGMAEEIYKLDDENEFLLKFRALQDVDVIDKVKKNNMLQAQKFSLKNTADGYEKAYTNKK